MKLLWLPLLTVFILSCSSKEVSVYEETKLLQIRCNIGYGTLDTFNDEYSQPAHNKLYSTPFYFSLNEQKRLIEEIEKVGFFNLPDTLKPKTFFKNELESINVLSSEDQCEIEFNGVNKKVCCRNDDTNIYDSEEYVRFQSVLHMISEIVRSRPEVEKLPRDIHY